MNCQVEGALTKKIWHTRVDKFCESLTGTHMERLAKSTVPPEKTGATNTTKQ
mgnify:CR=1 FL=1